MSRSEFNLLFPPNLIPILSGARGETWRNLVASVLASEQDSTEQMAFILMMVNLSSCITCNADSYRAMQGCLACARQSLKRFRGSDEELNALYQDSKLEVEQYLKKKVVQPRFTG